MKEYYTIEKIISYLPLLTIVLGLFGNTTCFLIFRLSKKFNKISSMVFLSFVAIFDTVALFEYNFNHFLYPNFLIELEKLNRFSCKFVVFIQVFSLHVTANLLSLMCVDRFVSIKSIPGSFYSRLPFGTIKSAYIWSGMIIIFLFLFNIHVLIFNGNYIKILQKNKTEHVIINGTFSSIFNLYNETENCEWYTETIKLFPAMDIVNLIVYNIIPLSVMIIFNTLLIVTTLLDNKSLKYLSNEKALKSIRKKRNLTISIISITFAFMVMTTPSTIIFSFFQSDFNRFKNSRIVLRSLDSIAFLFHSTIFFNCLLTNTKFRKFCVKNPVAFKNKILNEQNKCQFCFSNKKKIII
ncbi:unnamed protein product [Brachionus calyciflorus]|uniref:G-protein coupled receptors family 1 profile domain-containing protein n=1 Tax=Brachionus calyciflorus TaxID=104777 RepID=A0A813YZR6_9BILA|nr:unnamed protein product [Brachionus calyciflorus]